MSTTPVATNLQRRTVTGGRVSVALFQMLSSWGWSQFHCRPGPRRHTRQMERKPQLHAPKLSLGTSASKEYTACPCLHHVRCIRQHSTKGVEFGGRGGGTALHIKKELPLPFREKPPHCSNWKVIVINIGIDKITGLERFRLPQAMATVPPPPRHLLW